MKNDPMQPNLVNTTSSAVFGNRSGKVKPGYDWKTGGDLPLLGRHSSAKHDIYSEYVDRYIATLTKNWRQTRFRLTIVDGFCGGGLYLQDGRITLGSPLRLLDAVDAARATLLSQRPAFDLDIDFVFIDENRDHVAFLREQLSARGRGEDLAGGRVKLVHDTFENAAPDVMRSIEKKGSAHHSLFFLDQYGWSDVKLSTVRDMMSRLKNPEVILTFMVDTLINLLSDKTSSFGALARIDMDREDVRALLDLKNEHGSKGWKSVIQNTVYKHIQAKTGARFYTPFFIHPPESHRDYWLIHLSKHHQAREEMGKLHWRTNNTMEHFGGPGFDGLGFDPAIDLRQQVMDFTFDDDARSRSRLRLQEQIPKLLWKSWKVGEPVTKRSLFEQRANDTPVVGELVDAELAALRDAGEIVIIGRKADRVGDGARETVRERSASYGWNDEIRLPRQPDMFSVMTKAA